MTDIDDLLVEVTLSLEKEGLEYEYRTISIKEILDSKRDILEVDATSPTSRTRYEIQQVYKNRELLNEYLNEVGKLGWNLVGVIDDYNGLPYGGALIFKRLKISRPEKFEELENVLFQPTGLNLEEMMKEYEEKYEGKKAIWKNKLTNGFQKFMLNYGREE